jgi:hypothetical protein
MEKQHGYQAEVLDRLDYRGNRGGVSRQALLGLLDL